MIEPNPFTLKFQNEHILYENIIKCTVKAGDFNLTYNPTTQDSSGSLKPAFTGSFLPFATSIGLYNQNNELLMVAKFGTPMPMSNTSDITFLIKYDS